MKSTRKRRSNISREFRLPANVMHEEAWEDSGPNMKLSRAFIVVLVLVIVAVGGLAAVNLFDSKKPKVGENTKLPEKPLVPVAKQDEVSIVQSTVVEQQPVQLASTKAVKVDKEMSTSYFALQYGLTEEKFLGVNKHTPVSSGTLLRGETVYVPSDSAKRTTVDDLPIAPVVTAPREEPEIAVIDPIPQPKPPAVKTYTPPKKQTKKAKPNPNPKPKPTVTSKTYRVKKGDTLYSIARKYSGVSHQDIMRANGIGTTIRPGQTLKIPR